MRRLTVWGLLTFVLALAAPAGAQASTCTPSPTNPIVRFVTTEGDIDVQLDGTNAPCSVQDFEYYMDNGLYGGSFFHRSINSPASSSNTYNIVQGGGFTYTAGASEPTQIQTQNVTVPNEYGTENGADTLAMALSSSSSSTECSADDTATDEWFFNVTDNSEALDGGCYPVIGQALDPASVAVINKIAAAQVCDLASQWVSSAWNTSTFIDVPTLGYTAGACTGTSGPKAPPTPATAPNLIFVKSVSVLNDTTAPAITITSPVQHETLNFGQKVTPSYSCNDGTGTGVESCTGGAVDTNLYGTIRYTVGSEDYAGNASTKTVTYVVELPPAVQSVGTVSSKGVLGTTIHCPSSVACVGTAGLTAGKPAASIGTARFDIRAGGTASVRVSLTGAGWNTFRAAKWRLPATLVITPSGTGSQSSSRKVTLTKAKPKPKPKKHKKPKKKKKKKKK